MAAEPSRGRATEVERNSGPEADAARALYERHARQLYGFCLHKLGSREEAEDAVQTTFLNAFRGLQRGIVPEAEGAWLFKIAENVCLTRRRSAWRRGRVESPSDMQLLQEVTPAHQTDGGDELIPLSEALAAMPDSQRRAILLREWQGLSYKEISAEMDVSQSAVETLIFRARRSLATALETPWESRRAAGQAGQRAFNLGSLFAALKGLFAGGTAAKVAVVAVAATGTAALAAADSPREPASAAVEPSAASVAAPDSAARRPAVFAGSASRPDPSVERGGRAGSQSEPRRALNAQKKPAAGSGSRARAPAAGDDAVETKSKTREAPPGQAKERGAPADSHGRANRASKTTKLKSKAKPARKQKLRRVAPNKPKPAAEAKPAPKPQAESPSQPSAAPPPPPPPPPPPASPPAEKGKDKPKDG